MSYYIVNASGQPEGPHPPEWIRANAGPGTLVSHGQQWVRLSEHPEFQVRMAPPGASGTACPACGSPLQEGLKFCTGCGKPVSAPAGVAAGTGAGWSTPARPTPSPHMALFNLIFPGIGQLIFGQVKKGILFIVLFIISLPTVFGPVIVLVMSIIDGYKVGSKLRRTGAVGEWDFFPS